MNHVMTFEMSSNLYSPLALLSKVLNKCFLLISDSKQKGWFFICLSPQMNIWSNRDGFLREKHDLIVKINGLNCAIERTVRYL